MTPRTDKVVAVCDEDAYGLLVSFARQLEEEVNEARRYASRAGEDQIRLERELQAKDRTIERLKEALESIATKCLCGWEPPPDNCPCLSCTARKALQEPT